MKLKLIRSAIRLITFAVLWAAAALLLANPVRAQQIGYVLDLRGDWLLNGNTHLHKASSLPAGGAITANAPSDVSFIVVADREGKIIARRECRNQGACNSTLQLPQLRKASITRTIVDSVFAALSSDWSRYVPLISRGGPIGGGSPNEAVLRLTGNQIDVGNALREVKPGNYVLKFQPLADGDRSSDNEPVGPISFEWNTAHSASLKVDGLREGLYRLRLVQQSQKNSLDSGPDARVLISSAGAFDKSARAFGEAVKLRNQWGDQVKPDMERSFLRAYLERLATEQRLSK